MKEVMVKITTTIRSTTTRVKRISMEFVTEAKLYKRGEAVYLIYEESGAFGDPRMPDEAQAARPDEVQMKTVRGRRRHWERDTISKRARRYSGLL